MYVSLLPAHILLRTEDKSWCFFFILNSYYFCCCCALLKDSSRGLNDRLTLTQIQRSGKKSESRFYIFNRQHETENKNKIHIMVNIKSIRGLYFGVQKYTAVSPSSPSEVIYFHLLWSVNPRAFFALIAVHPFRLPLLFLFS